MDKIDRRTIGRVAAAGVGVGLLALLRGERTALAATPDGSLAQLQDVLIPIEAFVDTANDPATNGGTWDLVIADAIAEAGTVGPPVAGRGFTLAFGSKTYKFANTIVISAPMRLIGQGVHLSTSLPCVPTLDETARAGYICTDGRRMVLRTCPRNPKHLIPRSRSTRSAMSA